MVSRGVLKLKSVQRVQECMKMCVGCTIHASPFYNTSPDWSISWFSPKFLNPAFFVCLTSLPINSPRFEFFITALPIFHAQS